ncbi:hypothetical protein QBC35DRAFT_478157 [Podospora australis]|uniref:Uncharacterized protein n=1 Tax=Podospora australis TaxID=1536484 RepID=A0AAN6WL98_9PEZI|nr:hypothetical protein QBC35DRAFT_478157 [Podospora australis]
MYSAEHRLAYWLYADMAAESYVLARILGVPNGYLQLLFALLLKSLDVHPWAFWDISDGRTSIRQEPGPAPVPGPSSVSWTCMALMLNNSVFWWATLCGIEFAINHGVLIPLYGGNEKITCWSIAVSQVENMGHNFGTATVLMYAWIPLMNMADTDQRGWRWLFERKVKRDRMIVPL